MSEEEANRSHLPWIMAALVLVVGGAKLDSMRPFVGRALALAIPVVPVIMAVKRVEGGDATLERAASVVGWLTILAGEACVAYGVFHVAALSGVATVARFALYGAVALALAVHTLEARSQPKARYAAFIGLASVFAVYVSTHAGKDPFATVFGAFFVALFVGGGLGLLLGELLGRVFKRA
jgi:hypothetical protein